MASNRECIERLEALNIRDYRPGQGDDDDSGESAYDEAALAAMPELDEMMNSLNEKSGLKLTAKFS